MKNILLVVGYIVAIIILLVVPDRVQFVHYVYVFLLSILSFKEIRRWVVNKKDSE